MEKEYYSKAKTRRTHHITLLYIFFGLVVSQLLPTYPSLISHKKGDNEAATRRK